MNNALESLFAFIILMCAGAAFGVIMLLWQAGYESLHIYVRIFAITAAVAGFTHSMFNRSFIVKQFQFAIVGAMFVWFILCVGYGMSLQFFNDPTSTSTALHSLKTLFPYLFNASAVFISLIPLFYSIAHSPGGPEIVRPQRTLDEVLAAYDESMARKHVGFGIFKPKWAHDQKRYTEIWQLHNSKSDSPSRLSNQ